MALSLLVAGILELAWPSIGVVMLTMVAIGISAMTGKLVTFERTAGRSVAVRYMAALIAIALPMQLFGFAIALWVYSGGIDWTVALGIMVINTAVIGITLTSRLPSMVAGHLEAAAQPA